MGGGASAVILCYVMLWSGDYGACAGASRTRRADPVVAFPRRGVARAAACAPTLRSPDRWSGGRVHSPSPSPTLIAQHGSADPAQQTTVQVSTTHTQQNCFNPTTSQNYYVFRAPRYPCVRPPGGSRYHGTECPTGPGRRRRELARGHHPGARASRAARGTSEDDGARG